MLAVLCATSGQVNTIQASDPKAMRRFLRVIGMNEAEWGAFAVNIKLSVDDWKECGTIEDQAAYLQEPVVTHLRVQEDAAAEATAGNMARAINQLLSVCKRSLDDALVCHWQ